jgi:hypothetical protein
VVHRSAWESVTEREEFVGRLSFASRFPQYLAWLLEMDKLLNDEKATL